MRVPVDWVKQASLLGGKCLAVGMLLWFEFGVTKSTTSKLTRGRLENFGVERNAGRRALEKLEEAGMVKVVRGTGRSPMVTLVQVPEEGI